MALQKEISWEERLNIIDFDVVRAQMARKKGCRPEQVSKLAVRQQVKRIHEADARRTRRLYPNDLRPVRKGA